MNDSQQNVKSKVMTPSSSVPIGGLLPPPEPPRLIERLQKETAEASQVTDSEIYFYFSQSHLIGQGASSWVFRGYHESPEKKAAVKYITCKDERDVERRAYEELSTWEETGAAEDEERHPGSKYIISLYETACESNILYVAMEMAECSLEQEMLYNVESFKDRFKIIGYLRNIAAGLECLHHHKIVHRDIKPQNIFIVVDKSTGERIAKLGDFGLSRILSQTEGSFSCGKGTKMWMAPEVLESLDNEEDFLNTSAIDIFSFGLVASYCLRGRNHPFDKNGKLLVNIKDKNVKPRDLAVPKHAAADNLLLWMMEKDPKRRPSIVQCRKHPLLWEEEVELEFFSDVLNCLRNPDDVENLEDCAVIRISLDATYKSYFEYRYNWTKFNWTKDVNQQLLTACSVQYQKEYHGVSMMSFMEFVTDIDRKPEVISDNLLKEMFSESGDENDMNEVVAFTRKKLARHFVTKYPKMIIIMFCMLTAISPMYPCLEKLEVKYLKEFIGCHDKWSDEIIVKCLEMFFKEIQVHCKV